MKQYLYSGCVLAVLIPASVLAAEHPRYGAEDFLPTPQTPIGFQADGSGWYPGAKLEVLEWWDGKPGWAKVGKIPGPRSSKWPKPVDQPVFLDKVPKNILCSPAKARDVNLRQIFLLIPELLYLLYPYSKWKIKNQARTPPID